MLLFQTLHQTLAVKGKPVTFLPADIQSSHVAVLWLNINQGVPHTKGTRPRIEEKHLPNVHRKILAAFSLWAGLWSSNSDMAQYKTRAGTSQKTAFHYVVLAGLKHRDLPA